MKTVITFTLFGLLLAALVVGCSSLKATDVLNFVLPSGNYDLKQASYGNLPRQQMDIYLPKTNSGKPPIIFVYGGAWREGSKQDYAFVAHALTGLGYPVVIPDYRLYPQVRFPAFVTDVADAIQSLDRNALFLLGRPLQQFILMGHSAGAHTAALLATDTHYLRERGLDTRLAGLIGLAGPYDLPLDDPEVTPVFAGFGPNAVKPVLNVHPGMPPTLLLHGLDDDRVYPLHTQAFTAALQQAGDAVTTHYYPGVDHVRLMGGIAAPLRSLSDTYQDVSRFLNTLQPDN